MPARILVVEDNPTNLQLMEYLLRAFGHTVLTARDGQEGLDRARREVPDVILMDLQMPTLDGYQALQQLKAHPALGRIPVVAVTAFAMVGDRDNVLASGFDGYIAKPIAPETFAGEVEAFLGAARPAVPESVRPLEPASAPTARRRARILVVDNSPVNLQLVRSMLEPFGYEIVTAANAREGLDLARTSPPDLILSDVHMPGLNGYDLIRLVKADPALAPVPFAFLSSSVWADRDRRDGLALGAVRFILRPIEPSALVRQIEECLGNGDDSRR